MGDNELAREALALLLWDEGIIRPENLAREVVDCLLDSGRVVITPTPQVVDSTCTCTCPSGDGSLRWPCPQHPPAPQADVLAEVRGAKTQALRRALGVLHVVEGDHYGRYCKSCSTNDRRVSDPCPTHRVLREFDMGNLPEIPDSSPRDAWDEGFATGVEAGGRYMEQGGLDSDDVNPYPEAGR